MGGREVGGLGERIESLRRLAGLSARELDRLAGLNEGHTRLIETGVGGRPGRIRTETIAAIGAVFGVSLDWLYAGEGSRPTAAAIRASVEVSRRMQKTG